MKFEKILQITMAMMLSVSFGSLVFAQQDDRHHAVLIRTAVEVVPLNVMVTDKKGEAIVGLQEGDFTVYENGVEQPTSFFSSERATVSWGLVLDRSGSMAGMIDEVYEAALHVLDEGSKRDEIFIVTFNDRVTMVHDFTSNRRELGRAIAGLDASGNTALYDAVAVALDYIQNGRHQKKVLVVITDGEDNRSRLEFKALVEQAEEADVLIYTAGMGEGLLHEGFLGVWTWGTRKKLKKLSEATGATAHFPSDEEACRETMKEIAYQVSRHYTLGYYPTNAAHDGAWREVKVVVGDDTKDNIKKNAHYVTRTRPGYYAPPGRAAASENASRAAFPEASKP